MSDQIYIAKKQARKILGDGRYLALANRYRKYHVNLHPKMLVSRRRIKDYEGKFNGKRCFILGNGPSLRNTDLSLLSSEYTFGLNRIYLLFNEMGFSTTFYVSVNRLVIEQFSSDISALPTPKFLSWKAHNLISFDPDVMFLRSMHEPGFYDDVTVGIWEGATVTYVALQIAFYMGFDLVILIGVDHSFATIGKPHSESISNGPDPNHFHPDYFGKDVRWNLPDLEMSELAYTMARERFTSDGREILDATIGGKLQVFPKVDYYSQFA